MSSSIMPHFYCLSIRKYVTYVKRYILPRVYVEEL